MHTLTIETDDQATIDKLKWFLNGLKSEGVRIISRDTPDAWDIQMTEDVESGRLDHLINDVIEEFDQGKTQAL